MIGGGDHLVARYRSIASHEGLAEEAFEQSFGLLAWRTSGSAAPTASLRTASIEMARLGGVSVCRARGLPDLCRSPGECRLGRCRQDQGADPNEQDHARRDFAHESHLLRPSAANGKIIADRRPSGFHAEASSLMPEMAQAGEHHGEAGMIGGGDHLVVAQ
jgi:hypothetical protein